MLGSVFDRRRWAEGQCEKTRSVIDDKSSILVAQRVMHELPRHLFRGLQRKSLQSSAEKIRWLVFSLLALGAGFQWIVDADIALAEVPRPQYVLLRNDHVLRGTIISQGNTITVRRDVDAQLTLRTDQVLAIRNSLESLFVARQSIRRRGNRSNTADLLDDARWCVDQNMPGQATELLLEVYRAAPNHPVALQLEKRLRQSLEQADESAPKASISQSSFTAPDTVENEGTVGSDGATRGKELHSRLMTATAAPEDLHWFTSRVQPILISRCGQCHHSEASTDWKLVLPTSGTRVPQKGTMMNLQATLKYCDAGNADTSELFAMATTAHGLSGNESHDRNKAPIAEHEVRLMNTVASWINQLAAIDFNDDAQLSEESIGSLAQVAPSRVVAELSPPPVPPSAPTSQWAEPGSSKTNSPGSKLIGPTRLPIVENPNDVRHYNREIEIRRQFGL